MNVYKAISAVQGELAKTGIEKNRKNTQGSGYMFRGIDDVYNTLAPLLHKHGLCILPRMLKREVVERTAKSGSALFYITVEAEFDFVCAEDGSKHTVRTFGEAMDSGDKATNKAMSAAYKYAAFQAFAIPTEGDNDADAQTHEVAPKLTGRPTDGVWESIPVSEHERLREITAIVREYMDGEDPKGAVEYLDRQNLGVEEKTAVWTGLTAPMRSAIKVTIQTLKKLEQAA